LLLVAACRPAAAEDVIEMTFEGFGPAGIHVATTHTTLAETPASYAIEGDFATSGLGALVASVNNHSVTQGWQKADTARPATFDSETNRSGTVVRSRVDFRGDGTPQGFSTPATAEAVTPIPPNELHGTVDNLTAYLLLERQIARGGGCSLHIPVYDGRHRYDLDFSDGGDAVLKPAAGQKFSGPAHQCRMARREIGGFYVDKSRDEGTSSGTIWYAPLLKDGDIAVPVRMEVQTEIDALEIYLSQLRARGVNLLLMR
jgi:hypothetical protein